MAQPPVIDLDMQALWDDPYPQLAMLREKAPIAFVPQMRGIVFSRHADIVACEKNVAVFSSDQPHGLMNRLMGHNMMRKDGKEHLREKQAMFPAVSPKTVKAHWLTAFQADADRLLDDLQARARDSNDGIGRADLFAEYAMPLSGEALKTITGLTQVRAEDLDAWSQAMIAGIANYVGDPGPEARCREATAAIDHAIDERIVELRRQPDSSMLSVLLAAAQPIDSIRANIKLTISGGQNEPRDAIAGAIWALLTHPDQMAKVSEGVISKRQVFDEYVRWISPIGMSPRRIAKPFSIHGIDLQPDTAAFFMFGSANRDEKVFDHPELFDVTRDSSAHIAFGAGPHFCAGAAASHALVAEVGIPSVLSRLAGLALDPESPVRFGGWAFRGPLNLPVCWQAG